MGGCCEYAAQRADLGESGRAVDLQGGYDGLFDCARVRWAKRQIWGLWRVRRCCVCWC
jgi:hypothetical protein